MGKRLQANEVTVNFNKNNEGLSVEIMTPRLHIRSVVFEDNGDYRQLFSNQKVVEKYGHGDAATYSAAVDSRINGWHQRWQQGDPFNGLAVFEKNSGAFIGHIVLGRSGEKGVSELAYLFHEQFWGKGIGTEAVSAIINHYAVKLISDQYKMDGKEITKIVATTRIDHLPSQKILETVGFGTETWNINQKFGAERYIYSITAEALLHVRIVEEKIEISQASSLHVGCHPIDSLPGGICNINRHLFLRGHGGESGKTTTEPVAHQRLESASLDTKKCEHQCQ
jgi:RimJ/RimL family protein N-acetyltransferase